MWYICKNYCASAKGRWIENRLLSIESSDSHCAARSGHTGHIIPLSCLGVPPLHCVQIAPSIMPSYCIHRTFQDSDPFSNKRKKAHALVPSNSTYLLNIISQQIPFIISRATKMTAITLTEMRIKRFSLKRSTRSWVDCPVAGPEEQPLSIHAASYRLHCRKVPHASIINLWLLLFWLSIYKLSFEPHFELALILHCSRDHMVKLFYEGAVNSTEEHCSEFSSKIACHVFDEYFHVDCSLCRHQLICARYFRCVI